MEGLTHIDTHVAIFLYSGQLHIFNKNTLNIIENNILCVSEITKLEIQYLYEIGKIKHNPSIIINTLKNEIGLTISKNKYNFIIEKAITLDFTRDPFDRIIVADAMINESILITKDRIIQKNYNKAIW